MSGLLCHARGAMQLANWGRNEQNEIRFPSHLIHRITYFLLPLSLSSRKIIVQSNSRSANQLSFYLSRSGASESKREGAGLWRQWDFCELRILSRLLIKA
ncbi:hypothetical protein K1719_008597 [Acacia pycnantha]|nr:hypothetical protein K1719_008597 [Acacia pycnantha]